HPSLQRAAPGGKTRWSGLLPYADRRDLIQAGRPAGCWCLGYGGWDPHYATDGHVAVTPPYCGCEEGKAAAELARRLDAQSTIARQAEIRPQAGSPPGMSGWSFATYPGKRDTVVEHVQAWARGDEIARGQSLLLWGPPSRGKTGLAV